MKEHPLKAALILMAIPILFGFPLWETPIKNLINLLVHPSISNLFGFVFEWHFMLLIVIYLLFAVLFYSGKVRELTDKYEESKKKYQENLELMKGENTRIIEINKPKNN